MKFKEMKVDFDGDVFVTIENETEVPELFELSWAVCPPLFGDGWMYTILITQEVIKDSKKPIDYLSLCLLSDEEKIDTVINILMDVRKKRDTLKS